MKNIFIIGGSGLVGTHVVKEFIANGNYVTSLTRSGKSILGETVIQGDRGNSKLLEEIFSENNFDLVIDMIPFTTDEVQILSSILEIHRIPLIACSSSDVYKAEGILWKTEKFQEYQKCPISEIDELREKLSINGESYNKTGIEKIYLSLPGDVTIFRLPAIYGYPDYTRFELYLSQMIKGESEIVIPKEKINWKFCRALNKNCAYGIFLARKSRGKNIYNLAEEEVYEEKEWIEKIGKIYGWKGKVTGGENIEGLDFGQNWYLDTSKIREELGFFEKYNPDEGLFDAILSYTHKIKNITYTKNY